VMSLPDLAYALSACSGLSAADVKAAPDYAQRRRVFKVAKRSRANARLRLQNVRRRYGGLLKKLHAVVPAGVAESAAPRACLGLSRIRYYHYHKT